MRAGAIVGLLIGGIAISTPAPAQEPEPPPAPFSVERVQRKLQRPPGLELPGDRPLFRVSVTQRIPFDDPFGIEAPGGPSWSDRVNAKIGTGVAPIVALSAVTAATAAGDGTMSARPLFLMNALAIGQFVAGTVGQSLQNRRVRKTRERVQSELEAFCAATGCVPPPTPAPAR